MPGPIGLRTLKDHLVTSLLRGAYLCHGRHIRPLFCLKPSHTPWMKNWAIMNYLDPQNMDHDGHQCTMKCFPIFQRKSRFQRHLVETAWCVFSMYFLYSIGRLLNQKWPERSRGVNKMLLAKANQDHKGRFNLLTSKHFLIPQFCFWTCHTRSFGKS